MPSAIENRYSRVDLGILRFYLSSTMGRLFNLIEDQIENGMKLQVSLSPSQKFKYSAFFNFCSGLPAHFAPWSASNQQSNFEAKYLSDAQVGREVHKMCTGGWVWNRNFYFEFSPPLLRLWQLEIDTSPSIVLHCPIYC